MKLFIIFSCVFMFNCVLSEHVDLFTLKVDFLTDAFIKGINNSFIDLPNEGLCRAQLAYISDNVYKKDVFPFIDSWGRIPSGLLYGHSRDLGNYGQCMKIRSNLNELGIAQGQYCTAKIPISGIPGQLSQVYRMSDLSNNEIKEHFLDFEIGLRIGVCIPKSCSMEYVSHLLSQQAGIPVELRNCHTNDKLTLRPRDWIAIAFFSTIAGLISIGTIYDIITCSLDSPRSQFLMAFSAVSNARKVFQISANNRPNSVDCLNGIRAVSMVWVLYGHLYVFYAFLPLINLSEASQWKASMYSLTVQSAPIAVDTFLLLSGLLVAWIGLKEMRESNGRLNIPLMYLHRFIRLVPLLGVVILFSVTLIRYFGSGPLWKIYYFLVMVPCSRNWWKTLLFIQNYSDTGVVCLPPTWYLALDTHLYILSPIFLFALHRWGKKFIPVLGALCLISFGWLLAVFYKYEFKELLGHNEPHRGTHTYYPTHARCSPWLVGLSFGYILLSLQDKKVKIPKPIQFLAWITSFAIMLSVVFAPYPSIQPGYNLHPFLGAFYEHFSKTGWCFALCWIIFACHRGYGGIVNSILSYPFWQVIVRLTYAFYLTHWIVMAIVMGNVQTDRHFSDFDAALQFWSVFGVTFLSSIVLVVVIESPIISLEKILLSKVRK